MWKYRWSVVFVLLFYFKANHTNSCFFSTVLLWFTPPGIDMCMDYFPEKLVKFYALQTSLSCHIIPSFRVFYIAVQWCIGEHCCPWARRLRVCFLVQGQGQGALFSQKGNWFYSQQRTRQRKTDQTTTDKYIQIAATVEQNLQCLHPVTRALKVGSKEPMDTGTQLCVPIWPSSRLCK